jgi:hypothetical protein
VKKKTKEAHQMHEPRRGSRDIIGREQSGFADKLGLI